MVGSAARNLGALAAVGDTFAADQRGTPATDERGTLATEVVLDTLATDERCALATEAGRAFTAATGGLSATTVGSPSLFRSCDLSRFI